MPNATGATSASNGASNISALKVVSPDLSYFPAAKACEDLTENGFNDWYLPAKNELNTLFQGEINFGGGQYWSSTEISDFLAGYQDFTSGTQSNYAKDVSYGVRCVRTP